MSNRTWFKVYADRWLEGSISKEVKHEGVEIQGKGFRRWTGLL